MVEGGGLLNWQLLDEGLVDEIVIMQLPIVVGGLDNISMVDGDGYRELRNVKRFDVQEIVQRTRYVLMRFSRTDSLVRPPATEIVVS